MYRKLKIPLLIFAGFIAAFFVALIVLPWFLRDKIMLKAKAELNQMLNAKVDFENVNLSFIRNFPYASVKLENFYIAGIDEFQKDTLLKSDDINLIINIKSLFSDTGYDIRKLEFNHSKVVVRVLPNGHANWRIMKEDSTQVDTSKMNFHWKLKEFSVNNADIYYNYDKSNMVYIFKNVNHTTTGDLTADSSLLVTRTTCDSLSFVWDGVEYISKAKASIDADINADLNGMLFKISKNQSKLNEIPFQIAGWLKSIPEGWDMDFKLITDKVEFKSVLSLVPAIYSESFEDIQAGGKVDLSGNITGLWVGDYYPSFDLKLIVQNGWFQYPSLPKKLEKININTQITNPGRTLDATVFDISQFAFQLGGNPFNAKMRIANPMTDPDIQLNARGKINLGMIKDVYPLNEKTSLNGILDLNLNLAGRMSYYEKNEYQKYQFDGNMNINNMLLKTTMFSDEVKIDNAAMEFNNSWVDLKNLQLKIGKNDIAANGKLENFVPYILQDKTIKGQLNLSSNYLNISDFMSDDVKTDTTTSKAPRNIIKIPSNIDFTVNGKFNQILFDKMNLTNAYGMLKIADSELKIQNMNVNAFGGTMIMNGYYNVADTLKPKVNFDLTIKEVVFTQVAGQVESLQKLVPVFSKATGKFSTKINFTSLLTSDMTPDLNSLSGLGSFVTKSVGLKDVPALEALAKALKKDNLLPMAIQDLGIVFDISDGKLTTKPFSFKVKDVNLTLGGVTGLDKTINYSGKIQLPDKLNLGKLSTVNVKIGGTFSKPKVELDVKNTVTEVLTETATKVQEVITKKTEEVVDKALEEAQRQKEKAIEEARKKADQIIAEAEAMGNKLIDEAEKRGQELINKATNPIAKKAAQIAAKGIVDEAKKQAATLKVKAQAEAEKIIKEASNKVVIQK